MNDLFYNYIQSEEYIQNSENEETERRYESIIKLSKLTETTVDKLIDEACIYAVAREELGFINGFRHATQMMNKVR